jgi:hypothetical protein
MKRSVQIYVALLGEGVDVWRQVQPEHINHDIYRIIDQPYDRSIESWEFEPGNVVRCKMIESSDGLILAAIEKVAIRVNKK